MTSAKLKVVLNASPLVKGGALQACVSFARELSVSAKEIEWYFILSRQVADELARFEAFEESRSFVLESSPAKNKAIRKKLVAIVGSIQPDAVFSFFGPTYVSFSVPHLMGFADGWLTHPNSLALRRKGGVVARMKLYATFLYKRYWAKRADRWVVEAEVSREGLVKRFGLQARDIKVVPNNCGEHYIQAVLSKIETETKPSSSVFEILVFSSYYAHKNIEIVPEVASYLLKSAPDLEFKFILTLAKGSSDECRILDKAKEFNVTECLENIGPVPLKDGPALYRRASLLFMPSLLETSSAVFPEAMASGVPVVTTDLPFAKDSCGDAALYYSPMDASLAADQIARLLSEQTLYKALVEKGVARQKALPNSREKHDLYCDAIKTMVAEVSR